MLGHHVSEDKHLVNSPLNLRYFVPVIVFSIWQGQGFSERKDIIYIK